MLSPVKRPVDNYVIWWNSLHCGTRASQGTDVGPTLTDNFNYVTSRRTEGQLDGVSAYEKQPDHTHLREVDKNPTSSTCGQNGKHTKLHLRTERQTQKHQIERTALYIEITRRIENRPGKDYKVITRIQHRPILEITLMTFKLENYPANRKLTR